MSEEGVRKHRAPKGALRRLTIAVDPTAFQSVRKHRAPKGALRPGFLAVDLGGASFLSESTERQKVH